MFLKFCIFMFLPIVSMVKIICGINETVILNTDELIFFESINFPQTMTRNCEIKFILNDFYALNNVKWILSISNNNLYSATITYKDEDNETQTIYYTNEPNQSEFLKPLYFEINNTRELTFSVNFDSTQTYNAFQGHILIDDWGANECPLESISGINPFQFNDETQILYLNSRKKLKCLWKFSAPKGYFFKFVPNYFLFTNEINGSLNFWEFNISPMVKITFLNYFYGETQPFYIFKTQKLKIDFVIYNQTSSTDIFSFASEDFYFDGYLSIIKADPIEQIEACSVTKINKNTVIWTNIKNNSNGGGGYSNNAFCWYNFTLPWNNQIIVKPIKYFLEDGVDQIWFYDDNEKHLFDYITISDNMTLQSSRNGYDLISSWLFKTDGSYQSYGFELHFIERECNCARSNIVVKCDFYSGLTYYLMDDEFITYCGNIHCVFNVTIETAISCPTRYMLITLNPWFTPIFEDLFKVSSNGNILLTSIRNLTELNDFYTFQALFPPNSINLFEFQSIPSYKPKVFSFTITSSDTPFTYPPIILTKDMPSYILEMDPMLIYSFRIIQLDSSLENDTLEVFSNRIKASTDLYNILIYDGIDLTNSVSTSNIFFTNDEVAKSYEAKDNKIMIFKSSLEVFDGGINEFVLYFRAKNIHTFNCRFKDTVFSANGAIQSGNRVSMVAEPNQNCEIIILYLPPSSIENPNANVFENFFTTANESALQIFAGSNKNILFEFNHTSAKLWKNININSLIYSIIIPPNSSLLISLFSFNSIAFIPLNSFPLKSLWTSEWYGSHIIQWQGNTYPPQPSYNLEKNLIVKLNMLEFNMTNAIFQVIKKDGTILLNITDNVKPNAVFCLNTSFQFNVLFNYYHVGSFNALVKMEMFESTLVMPNYRNTNCQ